MQHLNRYAQGGVLVAVALSALYLLGIVLLSLGILQPVISSWIYGHELVLTLQVDRSNLGWNILLVLPTVLKQLVIIYCSWQAFVVIGRFNNKEYFSYRNFTSLRHMGLALGSLQILFGILFLFGLVFHYLKVENVFMVSYLQSMPFQLEYLILGFILFVIAKTFQRGVLLEETTKNIV